MADPLFLGNLIGDFVKVLGREAYWNSNGRPETLIAGLTILDNLVDQFRNEINRKIHTRKSTESSDGKVDQSPCAVQDRPGDTEQTRHCRQ